MSSQFPGGFNDDSSAWVFPTINNLNAHGKTMFWTIYVKLYNTSSNSFVSVSSQYFDGASLDDNIIGWIKVDSGIVGMKTRSTDPTFVTSGKNIGRKNQTNVFTQAMKDALGLYNKKNKKSVVVKSSTNVELYPPMLARNDISSDMIDTKPAYVQIKYNGVRAISTVSTDNQVIMYSRRKNLYVSVDYMIPSILYMYNKGRELGYHLYFDGELYNHELSLQEISGIARNSSTQTTSLNYIVYDCFDPQNMQLSFVSRRKILESLQIESQQFVVLAPTWEINDIDTELPSLYAKFITDGYEGAMIRFDLPYEFSYNDKRSKSLVKKKPVQDHEYVIVDYEVGKKGKAKDALMIICSTKAGIKFPVTPSMKLEDRKLLASKMSTIEPNGHTHFVNNWKNKMLIVYYDEESIDLVPLRARTKMELRNDY